MPRIENHARAKDFIRWERLPVAIAPDMEYDKDGCFSGSAVQPPIQCMATGDEKGDGKPTTTIIYIPSTAMASASRPRAMC